MQVHEEQSKVNAQVLEAKAKTNDNMNKIREMNYDGDAKRKLAVIRAGDPVSC